MRPLPVSMSVTFPDQREPLTWDETVFDAPTPAAACVTAVERVRRVYPDALVRGTVRAKPSRRRPR